MGRAELRPKADTRRFVIYGGISANKFAGHRRPTFHRKLWVGDGGDAEIPTIIFHQRQEVVRRQKGDCSPVYSDAMMNAASHPVKRRGRVLTASNECNPYVRRDRFHYE